MLRAFGRLGCALGFHRWSSWRTSYSTGYREQRNCLRPDCKVKQWRPA